MTARLEFRDVEPLLPPAAGELPTAGELPVPRWDEPETAAAALRWWRLCRRCSAPRPSIFDALMHQWQCGCGPDWPTDDEDGTQ